MTTMAILNRYFRESPYSFWSLFAAAVYVFIGTLVFLKTYFFYDSASVWYALGQWCGGKFILDDTLYFSYVIGYQLFMKWDELGFILGQTCSFVVYWGLFYVLVYAIARYLLPEINRLYAAYFGTAESD